MKTTESNPWIGISSYQDPSKYSNGKRYEFCGRRTETYDLLQLIENRNVVTLYGSTGIGKTSLLCAGVFPILRQRYDRNSSYRKEHVFAPVYIRLCSPKQLKEDSHSDVSRLSFAEVLIKCIQHDLGVEQLYYAKTDGAKNVRLLWDYFHSHDFYEKEAEPRSYVTPVIVLDQFEELFNNSNNDSDIQLFLRQLYVLAENRLMDDEHHPAAFRIVISLREDKFFYLEDYVDTLKLSLFKENRYRLLPMDDDSAKEVVTIPGKGIIQHDEKDEISQWIINQARDKNRGDINTLKLSLICCLIYEKSAPHYQFTKENVLSLSSEVLKEYYQDETKAIPLQERKRMEERLVQDGRRHQITKKDFLEIVPHGDYLLSQNGNSILRCENDKVEVAHDQLAMLMEEMKTITTYEIGRQRLRYFLHGSILALVLGLVLLLTWYLPDILWRDTEPLYGELRNMSINREYYNRPVSVPSGVLRLSSNVHVEYRAFQTNPDIRELHIGDSCTIDNFAFERCPNLRAIYFEGKGIVLRSNAFHQCPRVETIIVSDSSDIQQMEAQDGFPALSCIRIMGNNPNFMAFGNTLLVKHQPFMNGEKVYWNVICGKMERLSNEHGSALHMVGNVILPLLPDSIVLDSMKAEYGEIFDLKDGEVKDTNIYRVLTCSDPDAAINPHNVTDNPKVIGIDFPYVVQIMHNAYACNKRLRSVQLPHVQQIGDGAFRDCNELRNVYLPQAEVVEEWAFNGCSNLQEIQLPLLKEADVGLFYGCESLQRVVAPALKIIRRFAFARTALEEVELPAVERVDQEAFSDCRRLKRLSLPALQTIDKDWGACDSLEEIIVPAAVAEQVKEGLNNYYRSKGMRQDNFYEISEKRGDLSVINKVEVVDSTLIVDADTLDLNSYNKMPYKKILLSRRVQTINPLPRDISFQELDVEWGNPVYFSFKNTLYTRDGIKMNAQGVEHAVFMNFAVDNTYNEIRLSHHLKSVYLQHPQLENVRFYIEYSRTTHIGNVTTTSYKNDSAFWKTVTLRVPYGYKKYCENLPQYQLFGTIEELSRWETMWLRVEWNVTCSLWKRSNDRVFLNVLKVALAILLLLVSLGSYIFLYRHKRQFVLPILLTQLTFMLFFAVFFYALELNGYFSMGHISFSLTMLLVVEVLLLFSPCFFVWKQLLTTLYPLKGRMVQWFHQYVRPRKTM